MRKLVLSLAAFMAVLAASGHAMAADEHVLAWDNFALRVLNVIIFIGIIWYAAGALIKKFFIGHREAIAHESAELERLKKEAAEHLADVERRVAGVEQECENLLAEGKAQAERLKAAILADAEKQAAQMADEVQRFLDRAGAALDRQMDENLDDLRDLAIAIAEKVICVSLRSSTEIIGRMVQTALDKHKHREWVHIYIAESDIKRMGELPASLTSAISALSDRVRIVPMADDESGTCVIEMPDEIIDASVSTQLGNIRSLLSDSYQDENETINFSF